MEIRQGLTPESWDWIIGALERKAMEYANTPEEVEEVIKAMEMLITVQSSCPAIKLTRRELPVSTDLPPGDYRVTLKHVIVEKP